MHALCIYVRMYVCMYVCMCGEVLNKLLFKGNCVLLPVKFRSQGCEGTSIEMGMTF